MPSSMRWVSPAAWASAPSPSIDPGWFTQKELYPRASASRSVARMISGATPAYNAKPCPIAASSRGLPSSGNPITKRGRHDTDTGARQPHLDLDVRADRRQPARIRRRRASDRALRAVVRCHAIGDRARHRDLIGPIALGAAADLFGADVTLGVTALLLVVVSLVLA